MYTIALSHILLDLDVVHTTLSLDMHQSPSMCNVSFKLNFCGQSYLAIITIAQDSSSV